MSSEGQSSEPDAAEIVLGATSYPVKDATDDELRRAWILELLCATPEGPLFDTMVALACDLEAFLKAGTRPKPKAVK